MSNYDISTNFSTPPLRGAQHKHWRVGGTYKSKFCNLHYVTLYFIYLGFFYHVILDFNKETLCHLIAFYRHSKKEITRHNKHGIHESALSVLYIAYDCVPNF